MANIREKLLTILKRVDDSLKFAEAKNAVFWAASGTGTAAIFNWLTWGDKSGRAAKILVGIAGVFLAVSCLAYLLSFLPKLDFNQLIITRRQDAYKKK